MNLPENPWELALWASAGLFLISWAVLIAEKLLEKIKSILG